MGGVRASGKLCLSVRLLDSTSVLPNDISTNMKLSTDGSSGHVDIMYVAVAQFVLKQFKMEIV